LVLESVVFVEDRLMNPDESVNEKIERVTPVTDGTKPHAEREVEAEAPELQEPQHTGFAAQLRQLMQRLPQREARSNIKREQLKENRTKSFLLLAGFTVVLALAFFAMFSSPSGGRRELAQNRHPNLGRGASGENPDPGHSVTPLRNADTRNPDEHTGKLSPEDVHNTARQRMLAQASPSFGTTPAAPPPAPRPEAKDYALNKIQFPPEQPEMTPAAPVAPTPKVEKLTKASLVFVSSASVGRTAVPAPSNMQPAVIERIPEFAALPAGTRLVARLETPVSSAVKTPVVAVIEYNYERDGEIVVPAGSKAFGELSQANEQGYVGIQFHTIQMPDETTQKIEGHAVGLQFQPLRGQGTGRNTGKKFLVRSLTGVGTILAATVGVQSGTGLANTLSNNVLLRERVADNVAVAGEQQLNDLAYHQNIVVTVPGNARLYIVLAKPSGSTGLGTMPGGAAPTTSPGGVPGYAAASMPSVQELRELMELRQELTRMYQQQQSTQVAQTSADQQ
jgi:hypothetical protein